MKAKVLKQMNLYKIVNIEGPKLFQQKKEGPKLQFNLKCNRV